MKYLSFFHFTLLAILSSGIGFCIQNTYEGPEPRLLVKEYGAPDSKYATELTVYLGGYRGASVTVNINTNYQWFIDDLSIYSLPNWCAVTLPSGIISGFVTDKTLTFTTKGDNTKPFAQTFDVVLSHAADPDVKATIHVVQNILGEGIEVSDYLDGTVIARFKNDKLKETASPACIRFAGTGSGQDGIETCCFEVHSSRPWRLTVRPTGLNAAEEAGQWIGTGLIDDPSASAQKSGNNLVLSCTQTGAVAVWFTVQPNESNRYPRTAEIEIATLSANPNAPIDVYKIPIRQQTAAAYLNIIKDGAAMEALLFAPIHTDGTANPFCQTVSTLSNRNWTAHIPDDAKDWLSMDPTAVALDAETLEAGKEVVFTVQPNPNLSARTAGITIKGWYVLQGQTIENDFQGFMVKQEAKQLVFDVDNSSLAFAATASGENSAQTITVTSNHPWTITGESDDFVLSRTAAAHDVQTTATTVTIYPARENNDEGNQRTATYTISCGGETKTLTLIQKRKLQLLDNLTFAGTLAIAQKVVIDGVSPFSHVAPDWITVSLDADGKTLNITPKDNESADSDRIGSIYIRNGAGEEVAEVVVWQDKKWILTVAPLSLSFGRGTTVLWPPSTRPPAVQYITLSGYIGGQTWSATYTGATFNAFAPSSGATLPANVSVQPPYYLLSRSWVITIGVPKSTLTATVNVQQN